MRILRPLRVIVGTILFLSSALGLLGFPSDAPTWYRCVRFGGKACPENMPVVAVTTPDPSKVWNVGLLLLGLALLVPNSWQRLLSRHRARSPATLSTPGAQPTSTGIAYPRSLSMLWQGEEEILVDCGIAFYGLSGAKESPTELILSTPDSAQREICVLKLARDPVVVKSGSWSFAPYRATIRREQSAILLRAVRDTMHTLPMKGPVFVTVAMELPTGHARQQYAESGVQYDVPSHIGGRRPVIVEIKNWDGVPMAWAFDNLWSLSESDKAKLRKEEPNVWEKFLQEVQRRGLSYSFQPEAIYKVVTPAGVIRQLTYSELADLPPEEQRTLFAAHADLKEWYERQESDRMGPPGRPGAPWPEDLDQSNWKYSEMGGRVWLYRDICALPLPERERLKEEKPSVWAAYWDETLKRPQYVTQDGKRWTHEMLEGLSQMERLQVYGRDGDLLQWHLHGQSF
jgi:hypothetical protein